MRTFDRIRVDESYAAGMLLGGRYRLAQILGEGGFAVVWAATDVRGGGPTGTTDVAVKLMRTSVLRDGDVRARFEREVAILSTVQHPGLVRIFDAGVHDGAPYMVLERLRGRVLMDVLHVHSERGDSVASEARRWMLDLAAMLEALHAIGVVHRDLKPHNVMVTDDERLRLFDLGIAKRLGLEAYDDTTLGRSLGSNIYFAPEQLASGDVGPATDVYSLASVVYSLATLRMPWSDDGRGEPVRLGERGRHWSRNTPALVYSRMSGARPSVEAIRGPAWRGVDRVLASAWVFEARDREASPLRLAAALDAAWPAPVHALSGGVSDDELLAQARLPALAFVPAPRVPTALAQTWRRHPVGGAVELSEAAPPPMGTVTAPIVRPASRMAPRSVARGATMALAVVAAALVAVSVVVWRDDQPAAAPLVSPAPQPRAIVGVASGDVAVVSASASPMASPSPTSREAVGRSATVGAPRPVEEGVDTSATVATRGDVSATPSRDASAPRRERSASRSTGRGAASDVRVDDVRRRERELIAAQLSELRRKLAAGELSASRAGRTALRVLDTLDELPGRVRLARELEAAAIVGDAEALDRVLKSFVATLRDD